MQKLKEINIYTDGSSLGNPGCGGWGAILEYKGKTKEISGNQEVATNNQMELRAVIEALKMLKEPCKVNLFTDSSYVANAINLWLDGWSKKSFKKVKNANMWQEYLEVSKPHIVRAIWIRGHSGHPQNERCDKLAVAAAKQIKEK